MSEKRGSNSRPSAWEDSGGISLAQDDLYQFTQYVANSSLVPFLDPPIHDPDGRYMAQSMVNHHQKAMAAAAELEAIPQVRIPQTRSLIDPLANENCIAERVLRVTSYRRRENTGPLEAENAQ